MAARRVATKRLRDESSFENGSRRSGIDAGRPLHDMKDLLDFHSELEGAREWQSRFHLSTPRASKSSAFRDAGFAFSGRRRVRSPGACLLMIRLPYV